MWLNTDDYIMLKKVIDTEKLLKAKELIHSSQNIVITCHMSPDGDAIGSSNGFALLLKKLGKNVSVATPDQAPYDLSFLPEFDNLIAYTRHPGKINSLMKSADLIICLDYNGLNRVAQMADTIRHSSAKKLMIDHHLHPDDFCDVTISLPEMTSTCELLYRFIEDADLLDKIDLPIAECIYTGMMTDTGNFSYNSNKHELYLIVSELVKKGVDKDEIYKLAIRTTSEKRMRLTGYALSQKMEIFPENNASLIVLNKDDLKRFHYQSGDTETLSNMPLAIPEVNWSTFFREEKDYIKVSMRSDGDFAVNTLCSEYFNGGGHVNAAGGEFKGSMEEAIATYHKILEKLKSK